VQPMLPAIFCGPPSHLVHETGASFESGSSAARNECQP